MPKANYEIDKQWKCTNCSIWNTSLVSTCSQCYTSINSRSQRRDKKIKRFSKPVRINEEWQCKCRKWNSQAILFCSCGKKRSKWAKKRQK